MLLLSSLLSFAAVKVSRNDSKSSGHCEKQTSRSSSNASSSLSDVPVVKFKPALCFIENFNICSASMRLEAIRLRRGVTVSLADENTRSQGTADP